MSPDFGTKLILWERNSILVLFVSLKKYGLWSLEGRQYANSFFSCEPPIQRFDVTFIFVSQTNCTLKSLNLSYNGFSNDGALAIAEAFRANNTLIELDLR